MRCFAPNPLPATHKRGCPKMRKEKKEMMQREESFGGRILPAPKNPQAADPTHGFATSGRAEVGTECRA